MRFQSQQPSLPVKSCKCVTQLCLYDRSCLTQNYNLVRDESKLFQMEPARGHCIKLGIKTCFMRACYRLVDIASDSILSPSQSCKSLLTRYNGSTYIKKNKTT